MDDNVIKFRKPTAAEKHKGNSLCRHNRHRWVVIKDSVFDVKAGRLVTCYECSRCGKHKSSAH